ncbi:MAG: hypothetical protein D5S00_11780 [Tindallia sp. MSAO_Bac2]|nr:MAG: hypothetical protein D5S00_11780 [Tindallia sp. MSAO_Bac2]
MKLKRKNLMAILPFILIAAVLPYIMRVSVVPLQDIGIVHWHADPFFDHYSHFRGQFFIALSLLATWVWMSRLLTRKQQFEFNSSYYYIGGLFLITLFSTLFSEHTSMALQGFPARYEGFYIWTAYFLTFVAGFNLLTEPQDQRLLFRALLISATGLTAIGFFQYIGHNFFATDFGLWLMYPDYLAEFRESVDFRRGAGSMSIAFNNPNYVGSYFAMIFPLVLVFFLASREKSAKLFYGGLSAFYFLAVLGSRSRAGWVGNAIAIFLLLIMMRKSLLKQWKLMVSLLLVFALAFTAMNHFSNDSLRRSVTLEGRVVEEEDTYVLRDVRFEENRAYFETSREDLVIVLEEREDHDSVLQFISEEGELLPYGEDQPGDGSIVFTPDDVAYEAFRVVFQDRVFNVYFENHRIPMVYSEGEFYLLSYDQTIVDVIHPPSFGFEGWERVGSGRGYIFSRSFPIMKNTLLLGHGPDLYPLYFPQHDVLGKAMYLNNPFIYVDKPHNLYLQLALNHGVPALLLFLALIGRYSFYSLRLFLKNTDPKDFQDLLARGVFLAVIGYCFAGFFNDSLVAVSPVFWVLLALGHRLTHDLQKKHPAKV